MAHMRKTFTKFRSTKDEHSAWVGLAVARGQTLSDLIRFLLEREIRKLKDGRRK